MNCLQHFCHSYLLSFKNVYINQWYASHVSNGYVYSISVAINMKVINLIFICNVIVYLCFILKRFIILCRAIAEMFILFINVYFIDNLHSLIVAYISVLS